VVIPEFSGWGREKKPKEVKPKPEEKKPPKVEKEPFLKRWFRMRRGG
jgi:hypothetical protein